MTEWLAAAAGVLAWIGCGYVSHCLWARSIFWRFARAWTPKDADLHWEELMLGPAILLATLMYMGGYWPRIPDEAYSMERGRYGELLGEWVEAQRPHG